MSSTNVILSAVPLTRRLGSKLRPTFAYWMETEVHVYAFSIAANVLLSFFPFLIVMFSICKEVLGWEGAAAAIKVVLSDYFPGRFQDTDFGGFILGNLERMRSRQALPLASVFLLLFTANGIFEPLEVALNRAWGIAKNRSFLKNQVISLGLIFACGSLALFSTVLTGINAATFANTPTAMSKFFSVAIFKMAALPVSIFMLFLIYWLLPNAKVPAKLVIAPAIIVGLLLEAFKYVNLITWPLWYGKLRREYGPFVYSVTIIMWSFLGAMIILAGAEWAARRKPELATAGAEAESAVTGAEVPASSKLHALR